MWAVAPATLGVFVVATLLPSSPDLEAEVLGAILVDPGLLGSLVGELSEEDFFAPRYRLVWLGCVEAHRRGVERLDELILKEVLSDLGHWGPCGGWATLERLLSRRGVSSMAMEYAMRLRGLGTRRRLWTVSEEIGAVALEGSLDSTDAVSEAERLVGDLWGSAGSGGGADTGEVVSAYMDLVTKIQSGVELPSRLSTGIYQLDKALGGGFRPGWLVLVMSLNGHGKTALAVNGFAVASATQGRPVLVVSLEMPAVQIIGRLIGAESGVPVTRHDQPGLSSYDLSHMNKASEVVSNLPLRVVGHQCATVEAIRSAARQYKVERGDLGMVVVDYIQLVRGSVPKGNRTEEIEHISRSLKELAMELECVVVMLSQPIMAAKRLERRPTIRDSKGSGAIDDDADLGLVPWILANVDPDAPVGAAQIGMDKFRHGPRRDLSEDDVLWDGPRMRFVGKGLYTEDGGG